MRIINDENWEPHPKYRHIEVSTLGKVRNNLTGQVKRSRLSRGGRPHVLLKHNGKQKFRYVARLVLEVFAIDFNAQRHNIIHLDKDLTNCQLDNLDYTPR